MPDYMQESFFSHHTNTAPNKVDARRDLCRLSFAPLVPTETVSELQLKRLDRRIKKLTALIEKHTTPTGTMFWYGEKTGYRNWPLTPDRYLARVKACAESRNVVRMEAAINAMERTLGLDDVSQALYDEE